MDEMPALHYPAHRSVSALSKFHYFPPICLSLISSEFQTNFENRFIPNNFKFYLNCQR